MNDADNDGVLDVIDNSPGIANANQLDTDKDNVGMPVNHHQARTIQRVLWCQLRAIALSPSASEGKTRVRLEWRLLRPSSVSANAVWQSLRICLGSPC